MNEKKRENLPNSRDVKTGCRDEMRQSVFFKIILLR